MLQEMPVMSSGGSDEITAIDVYDAYPSDFTTSHSLGSYNGKEILVLLYSVASSSFSKTKFNNATISGGTLEYFSLASTRDMNFGGTFYKVKVTSSSCTISHADSCFAMVFD